jgi:hypothetical protein
LQRCLNGGQKITNAIFAFTAPRKQRVLAALIIGPIGLDYVEAGLWGHVACLFYEHGFCVPKRCISREVKYDQWAQIVT